MTPAPYRRPVVEAIEPRLLYSADLAPGLAVPADVSSLAEQQVLASTAYTSTTLAPLREIAFVDESLTDIESRLRAFEAEAATGRQIEVVLIGRNSSGVDLVSSTLAERTDVDSVHLVGHGSAAGLQLGSDRLDADALLARAAQIAGWAEAISADGEIILDGADAGTDNELLTGLAALTGADVLTTDPLLPAPLASALPGIANAPGIQASDIQQQFATSKLNFEVNAGQAAAGIDFVARGSGYGLALEDGNATLLLRDGERTDRVEMTLAGASTGIVVRAEGAVTSHTNYLVGTPDRWLQNVENYGSVRYDGVYDGIDVRYYGNQRQLEYDFIVAAGADWQQITLRFDGIEQVAIDDDGSLVLTLDAAAGRAIRFEAPVSYQDGPLGREAVESRYVLGTDGTVGFSIGEYDESRELVIDPVLSYGTYFGAVSAESARGIAVGSDGSVYFAGSTNAFSGTSGTDAVVVKLSADLSSVLYTSVIGGAGNDVANGIAVDAAGSAYVVGTTGSPTFYGNSVNGTDLFLVKLSPDGSTFAYARTIGAGLNDEGSGVAVDAAGQAYVVGSTGSTGFMDAMVAKFNAAGSATLFTYAFGGVGEEQGLGIAVDGSGQAVIVGMTTSAGIAPQLVNAFDQTVDGGQDAFVVQFNAAGSGIQYASLLGGNQPDTARAVAYGPGGRIYVTGDTRSTDFPATPGAPQSVHDNNSEAFLAVLDPAPSAAVSLTYATYLGGNQDDIGRGIAVDATGRAHIAGGTESTNFATSGDAAQLARADRFDAFYSIINPLGGGSADLVYSTYIGGSGDEEAYALALGADKVVLAGITDSPAGIARAGGADTTYGGGTDAFAVSFTNAAANTDPLITSHGGAAAFALDVPENTTAVTTVTATDADVPAQTLSYTLGGADAGLFTFDAASNALSFSLPPDFETRLDADADNVYEVTVQVSDGAGGFATQAISVTVSNANEAPVLASALADQSAVANAAFSYTVPGAAFTDVDAGDVLTYTATAGGGPLPAWLSFNPATRTFTGTPANTDAGSLSLRVTATDTGGLSAFDEFTLAVSAAANTDPLITSHGGAAAFALDVPENTTAVTTVTATDADVPAQTLSYTLGGADAGLFTFDAASNALSFSLPPDFETRLDADADNVYEVTVQVSDGAGGFATQAISVAVTNSQAGDVLIATQDTSIKKGDATLNYGQSTSLVLDKGGSSIGDGRILLQFDLGDLPPGATITGATLVMNATQIGGAIAIDVYELTQAWTEGSGTGTPDAANWTERQAGVNWTSAGGSYVATPVATLSTASPGTHTWDVTSLITRWYDGSSVNVGLMVASADFSAFTVTYDSAEGAIAPKLIVTIDSTNAPPVIASDGGGATASVSVPEDTTAVTTVTATDADVPAQTLSYTLGGADAGLFTFDAASNALSFSLPPDFETRLDADADNVYEVTVQVSDGAGGFATQAISVTVSNANEAPVLASALADQSAVANAAFSYTVPGAAFTDVDAGDVLTYTATAGGGPLPAWLSFNPATRSFTGTPANTDAGSLSLRVTATDTGGLSAFDEFTLAVSATANTDPLITSHGGNATASIEVAENTTAVTTVTASDGDLPAQTLTYSLSGPDAAYFTLTGNVLSFTSAPDFEAPPVSNPTHVYNIEVTVSDGAGGSDKQDLTVTVSDANEAPVLASALADQSAVANAAFSYTVPGAAFTDVDAGDVLTYTATAGGGPLPAWLSFNPATRSFTGTPAGTDAGSLSLRVTATDTGGLSVFDEFTLAVSAALPPVPPVDPVIDAAILPPTAETIANVLPPPIATTTPLADVAEELAPDNAATAGTTTADGGLALFGSVNGDDAAAGFTATGDAITTAADRATTGLRNAAQPVAKALQAFAAPQMFGTTLLGSDGLGDALQRPDYLRQLDLMRRALDQQLAFEQQLAGTSAAASLSLSAGYVLWLLRGGALLSSLVSSLPAWHLLDPLPVLRNAAHDDDEDAESTDRVERVFGHGDDAAPAPDEQPPRPVAAAPAPLAEKSP